MKKILAVSSKAFVVLLLGLLGFVAWSLYPHNNPQPLELPLISSTDAEGIQRLKNADAVADYEQLVTSFQAQRLASYCGVASGVSVLNALGVTTSEVTTLGVTIDQTTFFTAEAAQVRSQWDVMFAGMALADLASFLTAHGVHAEIHYMDKIDIDEFRVIVEKNLRNENDYIIVNYQREALGQGKMGHISPLSAYDRDTDSVLIMDVAAHKYPPTWAPIELLYAGMKAADSSSGKTRGFVEISNK